MMKTFNRLKVLCSALVISLFPVVAGAGVFPMVTNISATNVPGNGQPASGGTNYVVNTQLMEIGPWADAVWPSSMVGKQLAFGHRHVQENSFYPGIYSEKYFAISPECGATIKSGETRSETGRRAFALCGGTRNITHRGGIMPVGTECIAYAAGSYTMQIAAGSVARNDYFVNVQLAPNGCVVTPPADNWCSVTTPSIILDHGTIGIAEVGTSTANGNLSISCTSATTLKIRLASGLSYIPLSPAGNADIYLNGALINTSGKAVRSGVNTFNVTDKLKGITAGGDYSGSGTIIIEPM